MASAVVHVEPTEATPLLTTPSPVIDLQSKKPLRTTKRTVIGIASVALGSLLCAFLWLYCAYIPNKLRTALNGDGTELTLFHISSLHKDGIAVHVKGVSLNEDIAPMDVTLQPSVFSVAHVQNPETSPETPSHVAVSEGDTGRLVGSLRFPGLLVPKGSTSVSIDFRSTVENLNIPFIKQFIAAIASYEHKEARFAFRMQASPKVNLHGVGSWVVPMKKNFLYDKDEMVTPDLSSYNVTLVDKSITPVQEPSQPMFYRFYAKASFFNPTILSFAPLGFSVRFSGFYDGQRIVDVVLPSTMQLQLQHNHNATISGSTVPETLGKLMELVGEYAEGHDTTITLKHFAVAYDDGRQRVPWLEEILRDLEIDVDIPGAQEEEDGLLLGGAVRALVV
ncbi:hypothetical protein HDU85_000136 [Gaertneriomyces sp. JEL0708]|nr:hypothetical protein HDU85_000136 [Gaertneriomyces sp. JEL0708]